jgi:prepilin peptidase CpaA
MLKIGETLALDFFPLCMIYAALSDLFTMKISNYLSLALLIVFFPLAYFIGFDGAGLLDHFLCGGLALLIGFAFFAFGWIGGGDAKLAAATAMWFGWSAALDYIMLASVLGGVLTLALLGFRRLPLPVVLHKYNWLMHLHQPTTGVPYGMALALAALWIYPSSPL